MTAILSPKHFFCKFVQGLSDNNIPFILGKCLYFVYKLYLLSKTSYNTNPTLLPRITIIIIIIYSCTRTFVRDIVIVHKYG